MAAEETGGWISWIMGQEGGSEAEMWTLWEQLSGSSLAALMCGDSLSRDGLKPLHDLQPFCKQDLNRCFSVSSHPVLLLPLLWCFPFLFAGCWGLQKSCWSSCWSTLLWQTNTRLIPFPYPSHLPLLSLHWHVLFSFPPSSSDSAVCFPGISLGTRDMRGLEASCSFCSIFQAGGHRHTSEKAANSIHSPLKEWGCSFCTRDVLKKMSRKPALGIRKADYPVECGDNMWKCSV